MQVLQRPIDCSSMASSIDDVCLVCRAEIIESMVACIYIHGARTLLVGIWNVLNTPQLYTPQLLKSPRVFYCREVTNLPPFKVHPQWTPSAP